MIDGIIKWSLHNQLIIVLAGALALLIAGLGVVELREPAPPRPERS